MARRIVVLMLAMVAGLVALSGSASADHNPDGGKLEFEFCPPGEDSVTLEGLDCTYDEDGHIISQGSSSSSGAFVGFFFFAIVWALVPAFISSSIASGRNQSVGMAFLLGLVLGWIGLVLVYFLMKEEGTTISVSSNNPPAVGRTAPERIRELQTLRDQGLISDEEYESRKTAILAEI